MNLLRVLLVDDEDLARVRMRALLADCEEPRAEVAGEAADSAQALQLMRTQDFDVALLDIHMPGLSGVALAHALKTFERPPAIVFVTAHSEHASAAFDLDAADYLTKPVRLERLQKALQKAALQRAHGVLGGRAPATAEPVDVLVIHERNRIVRVPIAEVLLVRAELKYLTIQTKEGAYIADGALTDLEQRWGRHFLRTHRSALVARQAVQSLELSTEPSLEGWCVRLHGVDEPVPVSRRLLPAVRQAIAGN